MPRPVTLFTGQWADLSLPDLAAKAAQMGYDGLELACWGDHFDVDKAAVSKKYCKERWEILSDHGLTSFAISSHLVGQAVCDLIDERHKSILPPDVWGEGDPEKVRKRAAKKLAKTARVMIFHFYLNCWSIRWQATRIRPKTISKCRAKRPMMFWPRSKSLPSRTMG